MRRPVTDIALLAFIARKKADVISYSEATQACKSSSSASRALHQLIDEGMIQPKPKLIGLRYVTQYAVTSKGKQVSQLALHLTELRSSKKSIEDEKITHASRSAKKTPRPRKAQKNITAPRKLTKGVPKSGDETKNDGIEENAVPAS